MTSTDNHRQPQPAPSPTKYYVTITPYESSLRDVVELMAILIFKPVADQMQSPPYLVCDRPCGTGGTLVVAENTLAHDQGGEVSIHL